MALQINHNNEFLEVKGNLNTQNMKTLNNHIDFYLKRNQKLILSLERVNEIVFSSAKQLEQLYIKVAKNNKVLTIVGQENKQIAPVMILSNTSYIFSNDRV
ncbi:STAS domain-containing protein [Cellulophaga fucicola]|uniref:STAS domain-containing protein n=1 Tax=Cellulophaga fucicola TaxID=76595 RepID=UPI003EBAF303